MNHSSITQRAARLTTYAFLAAFGLMLTLAQVAYAEGSWYVNGKAIAGSETALLRLQWEERGKILYISKAVGQKIVIHCKNGFIHEGRLRGTGRGNGKILAKGDCETLLEGIVSAPCKPLEPIEMNVEFSLFLHKGVSYVRFQNKGAESMGGVKFDEAECGALPSEIGLSGSFVAEGPTLEKESAEQELKVNNSGLFATDALYFGEEPATIEFNAGFSLEEPGGGATWSGIG